jgi:hypothetical protein
MSIGLLRRRLGELKSLSQYGCPFSIGHYSSPVGRFRSLARRSSFMRRGLAVRTLTGIAMTITWPFSAFSAARRTHACLRARGREAIGALVLLDMYWLALRHSIPPLEYALYRFNEAEQRKNMHEYVYWLDLPGLASLNARLGADNSDVQDKDRFARICASYELPHVATLAVFDRGKQRHTETLFTPEAPMLWVKSLRLKGGAGGAKWIKDAEVYRNATGRTVPIMEIAREFCKQDCLVQPFIDNHSDLAHITNGALSSLRIVTGMDAHGQAEFVTALIALPHDNHETSVNGILCSIEYESGRIQRAALATGEVVANHPDTGAPILGVLLPFWRESIDLVLRAHATAFSRFAFLGWDVALTRDGPVLLETNSGWGAIFHQMLDGPIGRTAFSRLVSQYV